MSYSDPFRDFPFRLRIDTRKSRPLATWLGSKCHGVVGFGHPKLPWHISHLSICLMAFIPGKMGPCFSQWQVLWDFRSVWQFCLRPPDLPARFPPKCSNSFAEGAPLSLSKIPLWKVPQTSCKITPRSWPSRSFGWLRMVKTVPHRVSRLPFPHCFSRVHPQS